jgi:hypothetical protein
MMTARAVASSLALLLVLSASVAFGQDAGLPAAEPSDEQEPKDALPEASKPIVSMKQSPTGAVPVGEKMRLSIEASAVEGDDVTVPEQSFAPLELVGKSARVVPAKDGRQSFVFDLDFIGLTPGQHPMEGVELSVVTKAGLIGRVSTEPFGVEVKSLIANEPNAQLREPTKPVAVMEDDYTLLYVGGGLLGAALLALLSVLGYRWWQRREKAAVPPPPPRPPWEVAIEKLGALRRQKLDMVGKGEAARFIDLVSDVVREYLGGRFGFDGLETTSDEMLTRLKRIGVPIELFGEVGSFLRRCDLVKFAKAEPSADEADWVLMKAQEIVSLGEPRIGPTPEPHTPPAPPVAPPVNGGAS